MKQTGSATPRVLVAGIIVIAAGVGGFLAYRMNQPAPPLTAAEPANAPVAAARRGAGAQAPGKSIPDTLPDITLADREGNPRNSRASAAGR